jgi:hypothetical protein
MRDGVTAGFAGVNENVKLFTYISGDLSSKGIVVGVERMQRIQVTTFQTEGG